MFCKIPRRAKRAGGEPRCGVEKAAAVARRLNAAKAGASALYRGCSGGTLDWRLRVAQALSAPFNISFKAMLLETGFGNLEYIVNNAKSELIPVDICNQIPVANAELPLVQFLHDSLCVDKNAV